MRAPDIRQSRGGEGLRLLAFKGVLQKALRVWAAITFAFAATFAAPAWSADVKADFKTPLRILAFGDSLTAGYGLEDLADSLPAQLEKALKAKGYNAAVIQGGISGDTTTGGRSRLEWSLAEKPDAVIVALGGNDGLRAVDPKITAESLEAIVRRIQKDGTPVLIAGMLAPPNLGHDYGERFNAVFPKVAKDTGALYYPFILEGAITVSGMMQPDQVHPNPKGVQEMVRRMLPSVEKLVAQAQARRTAAP